jgi:hypothetical protein
MGVDCVSCNAKGARAAQINAARANIDAAKAAELCDGIECAAIQSITRADKPPST